MSLLKTIAKFIWSVVTLIGSLPVSILREGEEVRVTLMDIVNGQILATVGLIGLAAASLFPSPDENTKITDGTKFRVSVPTLIVLG